MLPAYTGLRATSTSRQTGVRAFTASPPAGSAAARPAVIRVVAQRAVSKKVQVILTTAVAGLGKEGQLKAVPVGYYRNFLFPQGMAAVATDAILTQLRKQREAEERARMEVKAKAQAMATALATIGKFVIKKKVGEAEQIFGSVTAQDVVDAIKMQTGRELERRDVTLPEIKKLGVYEATVKLHPEVTGAFKVIVQKDTSGGS